MVMVLIGVDEFLENVNNISIQEDKQDEKYYSKKYFSKKFGRKTICLIKLNTPARQVEKYID